MILTAFITRIRLIILFPFDIMLSFNNFQKSREKTETMQQFMGVELESKHLFVFIMRTWYKCFYTSYSVVELNKDDDDVWMEQFINVSTLESYNYLNVDWNTRRLCEQTI